MIKTKMLLTSGTVGTGSGVLYRHTVTPHPTRTPTHPHSHGPHTHTPTHCHTHTNHSILYKLHVTDQYVVPFSCGFRLFFTHFPRSHPLPGGIWKISHTWCAFPIRHVTHRMQPKTSLSRLWHTTRTFSVSKRRPRKHSCKLDLHI
jgi:hypothetical protein